MQGQQLMLGVSRHDVARPVSASSELAPRALRTCPPHSKHLPSIGRHLQEAHVSSTSRSSETDPTRFGHVFSNMISCVPTNVTSTFGQLVRNIIHDPNFAVVIKSVLLMGSTRSMDFCAANNELEKAEARLSHVANLAYAQGVTVAVTSISPWHICFAAVWQSVESVDKSRRFPLPRPLNCVIETTRRVMRGNSSGSRPPISCGQLTSRLQPIRTINGAKYHRTATPRTQLSVQARKALLQWFKTHYKNPYPDEDEKKELSKVYGLDLKQVDNFFGNKRMRLKRMAIKLREVRGGAVPVVSAESEEFGTSLSPRAKWERVVLSELPTYTAAEQMAKVTSGRTSNIVRRNFDAEQPRGDKVNENVCVVEDRPSHRRRLN